MMTRVCSTEDVPKGSAISADVNGVQVAVVHAEDDNFYAIYDECSHQEIPLSEGEIEGCTVECWLHGSRFDLRTGEPLGPPAVRPVPVYPLTVDGERVLVDVD